MAACSDEKRRVQVLNPCQGGPYLNRREADAAISAAMHLCAASAAPPCCGACVDRGEPCHVVVDDWEEASVEGPFYGAPSGGSGWYFRIPAGAWITYRRVPASMTIGARSARAAAWALDRGL